MDFRPIFAGICAAAGGTTVICWLKLSELTNTMLGYTTPSLFTPWVQGAVVSPIICLLMFFMVTRRQLPPTAPPSLLRLAGLEGSDAAHIGDLDGSRHRIRGLGMHPGNRNGQEELARGRPMTPPDTLFQGKVSGITLRRCPFCAGIADLKEIQVCPAKDVSLGFRCRDCGRWIIDVFRYSFSESNDAYIDSEDVS